MALHMGATQSVNASDTDPVEAVRELTNGAMADVVVEAAGEMETIKINTFSPSEAGLEPGLGAFHLALDYVIRGEIDVSPMITHHFSFTEPDVQRAFHLAYTRKEDAGRVLIHFV